MHKKISESGQIVLLLIIPILAIFLINSFGTLIGNRQDQNLVNSSLHLLLFLIPNLAYIILHKYHLSYLNLLIAGLATLIAMIKIPLLSLDNLSNLSLFLFNYFYFSLFIPLSYFAFFKTKGFKLKNLLFITGGIVIHIVCYLGLFIANKMVISLLLFRSLFEVGLNLYLTIGLAIAIGLMFFDLNRSKN